jgi:hypothetical protein
MIGEKSALKGLDHLFHICLIIPSFILRAKIKVTAVVLPDNTGRCPFFTMLFHSRTPQPERNLFLLFLILLRNQRLPLRI